MTQQPLALQLADSADVCQLTVHDCSLVAKELRRLHSLAQRQWVGLTDEEMRELEKQFNAERVRTSDEEYLVIYPGDYWQWQRAIEAKLREKNGGGA
jgi:predicted transglutaminase-like cysteine proteinase